MIAALTLIVLLICLALILWVLAAQAPYFLLAGVILLGFWFIGSLVAEYYGWNSKSVSKFFKGE